MKEITIRYRVKDVVYGRVTVLEYSISDIEHGKLSAFLRSNNAVILTRDLPTHCRTTDGKMIYENDIISYGFLSTSIEDAGRRGVVVASCENERGEPVYLCSAYAKVKRAAGGFKLVGRKGIVDLFHSGVVPITMLSAAEYFQSFGIPDETTVAEMIQVPVPVLTVEVAGNCYDNENLIRVYHLYSDR